ncbi:MAG: cation-translocating P-type ATPase [Polyangiaceae bacterium]|nr:cation-translocating P-type ATPase [Polyangiaceae bacterium]
MPVCRRAGPSPSQPTTETPYCAWEVPVTTQEGLDARTAQRRLLDNGPNEIEREQRQHPALMLAGQFKSPVVLLLVAGCIVAAALGELADAIAILAIVVINGVIGFFQEFRAERAVHALRAMTAPRARVRRDGRALEIPASEVVTGDVLLLEAGDVVAADSRVVEAHALATNESALTGESLPVDKYVELIHADAPIADRSGAAFMGTAVVAGTGTAVVTATGMATELGKVARLLSTTQSTKTPLATRLEATTRALLFACLGIVAVTAVIGLLRGQALFDVGLSAVSLAVAAIPEGLPAVVTIALALGVQRMADRHVVVRKLPAVETLGCTTVICTDKTGTLTTGMMTVRELWGADHVNVLDAAAACSDAELAEDERSGTGDPTEVALLVAAAERGVYREHIEKERPRRLVRPFDANRKRMSILRADGRLYVKGAPDTVLPLCVGGTGAAAAANTDMASRGLRVLAVAVGETDEERDLRLVGLAGMADPPRTEAIEAVAAARAAGIKTVMITGDQALTAASIARELGIVRRGESLESRVHARATPEDKLRIVREWKARGDVVAMTGDGVNDAPALREAHVGIAMGRGGTEVTREASHVVLADDNFASIVAGVREGRAIFDNIQKTVVYLLAGNAGELLVVLGAALFGLPVPLLPLHLLWINLVTDGFPALALVMDPPEGDVLQRNPRPPSAPLLGRSEWQMIVATAVLQCIVTLGIFAWVLRNRDVSEARNLAFSVLVLGELFRAFAARSTTRIFWEVGVFSNAKLLGVIALSVMVQLALHHVPIAQRLFNLRDLSSLDYGIAVLLGLVPVTAIELWKLAMRLWRRVRRASTSSHIHA